MPSRARVPSGDVLSVARARAAARQRGSMRSVRRQWLIMSVAPRLPSLAPRTILFRAPVLPRHLPLVSSALVVGGTNHAGHRALAPVGAPPPVARQRKVGAFVGHGGRLLMHFSRSSGWMPHIRAARFMAPPVTATQLARASAESPTVRARSFTPPMAALRAAQRRVDRDGDPYSSPERIADTASAAGRVTGFSLSAAHFLQSRVADGPEPREPATRNARFAADATLPEFEIGQALDSYFFRQSRLPPSGAAAFDPRITPGWTGWGLI
ncbi:MAG: hypothetical protein POH28_05990 [Acidocella sp.]|nr:hypothetical protein [Acidocella sp.]